MNNIYVDELPKKCKDCPLHNEDNGWCQVLICYTDDVPTDCPLKPLSDRFTEERKKVVQEIKEKGAVNHPYNPATNSPKIVLVIDANILDQIERDE